MKTPQDYGLPHKTFRPQQLETIHWIERKLKDGGTALLEMGTGLGKTGVGTALCTLENECRAVCLVYTKALQQANYGNGYNWDVLFGRNNYPCVNPENALEATAEDCLFGNEMSKCEESGSCLYMHEKHRARASQHASLNYAYWLVAGKRWMDTTPVDYLIMDEAHMLPEVVINHAGATWTDKQRRDWGLTSFPVIGKPQPGQSESGTDKARSWIHHSASVLASAVLRLEKQVKNHASLDSLRRLKQARRLLFKLETVGGALDTPEDWFIRGGKRAVEQYGKTMGGLVVKPLTARYHFNYSFNAKRRVLMSATIGGIGTFASELGLDDYDVRQVPNQYPPDQRQIHILDVPPMGRKKRNESLDDYKARKRKQVQEIVNAIRKCPEHWSGIIHVNSKAQARDLAREIRYKSPEVGDRIWITPGADGDYVATDEQLNAWDQRKLKRPNSLAISWSMWEGVDLLEEKIDIVAKIPFPYLGNEYEMARLDYSHSFFNWRAATKVSQGLGRTRRGRPQDYGEENGFVAIADGSWTRIRKYLSNDVQEAIVE